MTRLFFGLIKFILFFPGYIVLAFLATDYLKAREWGDDRNVTHTARMWAYRDVIPPITAIAIYALIAIAILNR